MEEISSQLLKTINAINMHREFQNAIIDRANEYLQRGAVYDVKFVSDSEITAKVKGTTIYTTTVELVNNKQLKMDCTCQYGRACKHEAALISYIKANVVSLDIDYELSNPKNDRLKIVKSLFQKVMSMHFSYWASNSSEISKIEKSASLLINNILGLLKVTPNEEACKQYLNILYFFYDNDFNYIKDNNDKLHLVNAFNELLLSPTPEFLNSWKKFLSEKFLDDMMPLIDESILNIKSQEESLGFCKFIESTLELVLKGEIYFPNLEVSAIYIDKMTNQLINYKLDCLKQYESDEAYRSYLENMSPKHEDIETKYLSLLYQESEYEKIIQYVETNKDTFSSGKIFYNGILLNKSLITMSEFSKTVIDIFKDQCKINDFNCIMKIMPQEAFNEIKDKLLKIAKKNNKYIYLEMEIIADVEKGYELVKQAGVIELNRHVEHFLPQKEDELLLYYQEQLVTIFSKIKGVGAKFYETMRAIKRLEGMKNGKYYVFSIYRMARERTKSYDMSGALESLYEYIDGLDL